MGRAGALLRGVTLVCSNDRKQRRNDQGATHPLGDDLALPGRFPGSSGARGRVISDNSLNRGAPCWGLAQGTRIHFDGVLRIRMPPLRPPTSAGEPVVSGIPRWYWEPRGSGRSSARLIVTRAGVVSVNGDRFPPDIRVEPVPCAGTEDDLPAHLPPSWSPPRRDTPCACRKTRSTLFPSVPGIAVEAGSKESDRHVLPRLAARAMLMTCGSALGLGAKGVPSRGIG